MVITLLQQMIHCDYMTNVSRNLTFIIFIADGSFMKLRTYNKFYNCGPSAEQSKYNFMKTFVEIMLQCMAKNWWKTNRDKTALFTITEHWVGKN